MLQKKLDQQKQKVEVPQKKKRSLTKYKSKHALFYIWTKRFTKYKVLRGGKCIISRFHSFSFRVSAVQPGHFLRRASVLWHFGVILRVNVPAHADGQDHPQQLENKTYKHFTSSKHILSSTSAEPEGSGGGQLTFSYFNYSKLLWQNCFDSFNCTDWRNIFKSRNGNILGLCLRLGVTSYFSSCFRKKRKNLTDLMSILTQD